MNIYTCIETCTDQFICSSKVIVGCKALDSIISTCHDDLSFFIINVENIIHLLMQYSDVRLLIQATETVCNTHTHTHTHIYIYIYIYIAFVCSFLLLLLLLLLFGKKGILSQSHLIHFVFKLLMLY